MFRSKLAKKVVKERKSSLAPTYKTITNLKVASKIDTGLYRLKTKSNIYANNLVILGKSVKSKENVKVKTKPKIIKLKFSQKSKIKHGSVSSRRKSIPKQKVTQKAIIGTKVRYSSLHF